MRVNLVTKVTIAIIDALLNLVTKGIAILLVQTTVISTRMFMSHVKLFLSDISQTRDRHATF
jgi:hypothetical protein